MGPKKFFKKIGKVAGQGAVHAVLGPDAATTLFGGSVAAVGTIGTLATVLNNPEMWGSVNEVITNLNTLLVNLAVILAGLGLMKTRVGQVVGGRADKESADKPTEPPRSDAGA